MHDVPDLPTDSVAAALDRHWGIAVESISYAPVGFGSYHWIAIQADRPFSKLFAAGLTTIIGIQTFVIIGGVTRVIPLTGVTLPFVSYGGSSLVANFVIVALLLRISADNVSPVTVAGPLEPTGAAADDVAVPERRR